MTQYMIVSVGLYHIVNIAFSFMQSLTRLVDFEIRNPIIYKRFPGTIMKLYKKMK